MSAALPEVAVLMATHDGGEWIDEQVESIVSQEGVRARIVVSDDASTDDTLSRLEAFGDAVTVLPAGRFGSAQANFARLIRDADVAGADAVAFADQDDVWVQGRLARQVRQLERFDAVSSNVTAVFGDRRVLLQKAQPQRRWDFVCESAGPGSTFVLRPATLAAVRNVVASHGDTANAVPHDWLVYAAVRAAGGSWNIDPASSVDYRQHGDNVRGANVGFAQARIRLAEMRSGSHRGEAARIAALSAQIATGDRQQELRRITRLLAERSRASNRRLLPLVRQLRRSPRDRFALGTLVTLGMW